MRSGLLLSLLAFLLTPSPVFASPPERDENAGRDLDGARLPADDLAPRRSVPPRAPAPTGYEVSEPSAPAPLRSSLPVVVVGLGVLLVLVFKVFLPGVLEVGLGGLLRRHREDVERSSGGMTVTLRPRKERLKDLRRKK